MRLPPFFAAIAQRALQREVLLAVEHRKRILDRVVGQRDGANGMTKNFVIDEKYIAFNNKFNYLNDGKASKRIIDKIFFPI